MHPLSDLGTGHPVARAKLAQAGDRALAARHGERAAGVEHAAARRIDRTRNLALNDLVGAVRLDLGVGNRHRVEQGARIV